MTPQQWRRIEELFDQAVELPPGERLAFLDTSCGGDDALRRQVEAMLASDDFSSTAIRGIVESVALSASGGLDDSHKTSEMAGRHFGPWLITGTMESDARSAVYRAVRDDDAGRRPVELRIFDRAFASDSARARFHQKRQILGLLDHPNIARLIDPDGDGPTGVAGSVPYLVSESVDGVPITEYCAGRRLSLKERLRLFLPVCDAVAYANRKGVTHQRLKPSKILVTQEGTVKVLDFGIAALQDHDPATEEGGPNFIAADIASLGSVLYEILSGAKMTAGAARSDRQLPDDLDAIVAKAMRKPPSESYPSVEDMSADIRRYVSGFPVSARKPTVLYRARKYTARNRLPLAAALITAGGLIGGTVFVVRARQRAEQRHRELNTLAGVYLSGLDQNSGNSKTRDALIVKTLRYLDSVASDGDGDVEFEDRLAEAYAVVGELQEKAGPAADRRADGLESYRKSLRIRRAVAAANPGDIGCARALSQCLERLGELCFSRRDLAGARNYVSEALKILGSRGRAPSSEDLRLLAVGNETLAGIEERDGNAPPAVDAAQRAVAWRQRLSQDDTNLAARRDLARASGQLGRLQRTRGDLEGAFRSLLAERDLREAIAGKDPADTTNLSDMGAAVYTLALLSGGVDGPNLRDLAAARRYLEQSIAMGERLLNGASNNAAVQSTMADRYGALAELIQSSETASAIGLYRKAIVAADRLPGNPGQSRALHARWSSRLSYALRRAGKAAEARSTAEAPLALMLELDLDHADPATCRDVSALYRAVGAAALQAGEFEAAREAYSKSMDWTARFFDRAHTNLELAAEISASWEGLETSLRSAGDRAGALKLQGRRLAFWRQWEQEMPSPYTKWQLERANYFF